jgi:hypothetical protein
MKKKKITGEVQKNLKFCRWYNKTKRSLIAIPVKDWRIIFFQKKTCLEVSKQAF